MNIKLNFDCVRFDETVLMGAKNKCTIKIGRPLHIVKRGAVPGSLDNGLKEQAMENGVRINFNTTAPMTDVDIIATGPAGKESFAVDTGIVFETDMKNIVAGLIDTRAEVKAYSYFIVTDGYGCICTMLADKFTEASRCLETTKKIFTENYDFQIRNPRKVGGVGTFTTKDRFESNGKPVVGEAAGIQDMLGGFGIREAITSGHMAARCLIENVDYGEAAKKYFGPRRKATVVGRFLYELLDNNFIHDMGIAQLNRGAGMLKNMNDRAIGRKFGLFEKAVFPAAMLYFRKRYKSL